ncbi:Frataxin-like domain-containing protein [Thermoascus aurantiacus ATCC 26904]
MLSRTPRAVLSSSALRLGRLQVAATPAALQFQSRQSLVFSSSQCRSREIPRRSFHATPSANLSDPNPPKPQSQNIAGGATHVTEPTPLTNQQYHEYADYYLNYLLSELEKAQEEGSDIEAEYSAGVLNIIVPSAGTYVLNKQPPNKQIWLSSPISGPKRYDWVVEGDQTHEKQDTRYPNGQWIYLRDGSNLTDLLNAELSLNMRKDIYNEEEE